MDYREEAIECVKDCVLPIHQKIYAKYNGDFDRIYSEGYNSKSYQGRTARVAVWTGQDRLSLQELHYSPVELLRVLVRDEVITLDKDKSGVRDTACNQPSVSFLYHVLRPGDDQCL